MFWERYFHELIGILASFDILIYYYLRFINHTHFVPCFSFSRSIDRLLVRSAHICVLLKWKKNYGERKVDDGAKIADVINNIKSNRFINKHMTTGVY